MSTMKRFGFLAGSVGWLILGASACGDSGGDAATSPGYDGAACTDGGDCVSGVCTAGECAGNGLGAPPEAECTSGATCASGICTDGACAAGSALSDGRSCAQASECESAICADGVCGGLPSGAGGTTGTGGAGTGGAGTGGAGTGGAGTGGTAGLDLGEACIVGNECASGRCADGVCAEGNVDGATPSSTWIGFEGLPESWRPLTPGCGPDSGGLCTGECEGNGGDPAVDVLRPAATLCFLAANDASPEDPSVVIEQVIESLNGQQYVHLRVTFDPSFTDATYGTGAVGWPPNRGHTMRDLSSSDHTELLLTNGAGDTALNFKIDLVTADASGTCGYATAGVTGGDGAVITGDAAYVLAASTSMDRNFNGCGYCDLAACGGDCTVNSPTTDETYAVNAEAPDWDYLQVYEVWIDLAAFGDSGFGQGYITYTHSSPAKTDDDTLEVDPAPCPPDWSGPYCAAGDPRCGGGEGGAGGTTGGGDPCPPNSQLFYVAEEGASICTPIPYANYPGMAACPAGYALDVASEGQYCLPL